MVSVIQAQLQCYVVSVKQIQNARVYTCLLFALYSCDALFLLKYIKASYRTKNNKLGTSYILTKTIVSVEYILV
jgi:hypothetical protein